VKRQIPGAYSRFLVHKNNGNPSLLQQLEISLIITTIINTRFASPKNIVIIAHDTTQ
jgi:hypothetical protein